MLRNLLTLRQITQKSISTASRRQVKNRVPELQKHFQTLRQITQKSISTASRRQVKNRVPELQKHFQEDNGVPVYLKGGIMDAMLYRTTMILSVFGTGYLLYVLFNAAMPKKNN